jgi:hypothetical protein
MLLGEMDSPLNSMFSLNQAEKILFILDTKNLFYSPLHPGAPYK